MTRRQYSREFKQEAVQLITERGVSVAQVARELDLHQTVLRRWVQQHRAHLDTAFPGKGQIRPEDDEVRQLRREVARLKAERDILKKPRPSSPKTRSSVRVYSEAPGDLADQLDVWDARCLTERLPCLVGPASQCTGQKR